MSQVPLGLRHDETLWQRVQPFAGLVRRDTFGYPVVIPQGERLRHGGDRPAFERHALHAPQPDRTHRAVHAGAAGLRRPRRGDAEGEWKLKPARELLDLKICDMACGSGAFLVQACRYLSERLVEAWKEAEAAQHPGQWTRHHALRRSPRRAACTSSWSPGHWTSGSTYARRIIAQRCLYGVDKNPLAVEMAKLSLWLLTLAKDKPFEFLDHAIRCGDSLVGIHDLTS